MNILTLDTATEACSVALDYNGSLYTRYEVCPQQHSQKILPMVEAVLHEAGTTISALDGLAFGQGPGSFTGVRIATGIIQGLALGTNLKVVGVSTLAAMAQQVISNTGANSVAVAIDARMNEVYFARYQNQNGLAHLLGTEHVIAPDGALTLVDADVTAFAGTGWSAYPTLNQFIGDEPVSVSYPYARFMSPLAHAAFTNQEGINANEVNPVYLRDTVTWKKLPGR